MNNIEFDSWYADFATHYPETKTWLQKQGAPTLRTWKDALSDCLLSDALDATAQCHRGAGPTISGPSQWPAAIRQLCKERENDRREQAGDFAPPPINRPRWRDGEETFTCPICLDTDAPTVLVLAPHTVRQLLAGVPWEECKTPIGGTGIGTVAVACCCQRGVMFAEKVVLKSDATTKKTGQLPVYEAGRMFRMQSPSRTEPADLAEWLAGLRQRKRERMPNYESAFDDFR